MSQLFDKIKVGTPNRSTFDLSHHQVTTSDFGMLIPICYRDMLPNDDFVVRPDVFCRLAPLAVPTYGRIKCRIHHFFVPYRILFPYWSYFITGNKNNATVPPYFTAAKLRQWIDEDKKYNNSKTTNRGIYTRLMENLGLNPTLLWKMNSFPQDERFSAFPFLAYYRIWLDYFMDSNIEDHSQKEIVFKAMILDGGDLGDFAEDFLVTRNGCFKKDYFTTAKLNPQAGEDPSRVGVDIASDLNESLGASPGAQFISVSSDSQKVGKNDTYATKGNTIIGQFTIEALRAANSLQNYLERSNFVGSKVINQILAHFGIAPTPERLDYAEFIGGSSFPIQIGDVTSTTPNFGDTSGLNTFGLGAQAGKGIGAGQGETVRYHAKEHGVFMSLMSIIPDTGYYQGISRFWHKGLTGDPLDFFTPEFENLGYQELLNKEVYNPTTNIQYSSYPYNGVFGYTPRYSEYKFQQDVLAGDFINSNSNSDTPNGSPNDSWHLFRTMHFTTNNPIALNSNFVECDNRRQNYDRIFQVTDNQLDHFYFNIDVDVKATRPMSSITAPTLDTNAKEEGREMDLPYGGTRL